MRARREARSSSLDPAECSFASGGEGALLVCASRLATSSQLVSAAEASAQLAAAAAAAEAAEEGGSENSGRVAQVAAVAGSVRHDGTARLAHNTHDSSHHLPPTLSPRSTEARMGTSGRFGASERQPTSGRPPRAGGTTVALNSLRRRTSPGSIAAAVASAAPLASTMGGLSVGVGGVGMAGFGGDGAWDASFLPGLVQRPGSDPTPTGHGHRAAESIRAREARQIRERDHLDRARDAQQQRERERERQRQRERGVQDIQGMVLGGCGMNAAAVSVGQVWTGSSSGAERAAGKVGRHAAVGVRYAGGGQLLPLNHHRITSHGPGIGLYETTLS